MLDFELTEKEDVWTHLKNSDKPVVLYGMGNGADKIIRGFEKYGISVSDIFMSDEMYRENCEFHGHTLLRYEDIKNKYDDCVVVLTFAVFRRDMLRRIADISKDYELVAPCASVFGDDIFTVETLASYEKEINGAYSVLYDDFSRFVFRNLLEYRVSGNPKYLFDCQTEKDDVFKDILSLGDEEVYVDLGAYRGDTIEEFLYKTKARYRKIIALEPDKKNFDKLVDNFGSLENAEFINKASWSDERLLNFSGGGGRNSSVLGTDGTLYGDAAETVHTTAVDLIPGAIDATFIKMDVEGAEAETLAGLKNTLKNTKPKLQVSAYHRITDLFTLPVLIREINPDYRIYLRHHPYIPDWETNLYCK